MSQSPKRRSTARRVIDEDTAMDPRFNDRRKTSRYQEKVPLAAQSPRPFHIQPKTAHQADHMDAIQNNPITVVFGPAGTGKTYISMMMAAKLFMTGDYDNIVMSRSIIPTGKSMGFLPGDVKEKMIPWLLPMICVLEKAFTKPRYEAMFAKEVITIQPLETIRGRSFENSLIFIDEAQNLNYEELKAITTRLGENSKMVLMGDTFQSDIDGSSALLKFTDMCYRHGIQVPIIEYDVDDIVRSDIVASLVKMFMAEAQASNKKQR